MPTYEYQCASCGHQLESFQKMSDAPLVECPKCHQPALTKLVSASGIQFKGSGWYATDYSKKGQAKQDQKTTEGSGDKEKSSTETTDTKTKASDTSTNSGESAK